MTNQNLNQPQKEGENVEQKKNFVLDSLLTKFIEGGQDITSGAVCVNMHCQPVA